VHLAPKSRLEVRTRLSWREMDSNFRFRCVRRS
jgi:hypothetical protein